MPSYAANSIEVINAAGILGDSASNTLDFSTTAFQGVTLVEAQNGNDNVVTSLSRIPGLVYDGGNGNDRITVTLAPSDFLGALGGFGATKLIKDIGQSLSANFDTGFTFDESLGLTVREFELGLKYGWFTLAGNLAEAALANVTLTTNVAGFAGTATNDLQIGGSAIDTYNAGAGDDLMVHARSSLDRFVTGGGDDTIVAVGNVGGRINDVRDGGPDTGLDQMFVVGGTTFSLDGGLNGMEYIEFSDAAGAGEIRSNGTNIAPDFTDTVLRGVNAVTGAGNLDRMVTAREHHEVGGGEIVYDGGPGSSPYDTVKVNFGAFTQLSLNGLRSDLMQLLGAGVNVSTGAFSFDQAFDGFDLTVQNFGDTRVGLDPSRVKLGYVGHDGALVEVAPDAAHVLFGAVPSFDTLTGTAGNDILLRGGNGEIMQAGDGDDLLIAATGSGRHSVLDGGEGSDTYVAIKTIEVSDTGTSDHDRMLAVADGQAISTTLKLAGIEEINANGFEGVELHGSATNDQLDLSDTFLFGIDTVRTHQNGDSVTTHSMGQHVTYDGGSGPDTLTFALTGPQAGDPAVTSEIAQFFADGGPSDYAFDALDFSIVGFENVVFV